MITNQPIRNQYPVNLSAYSNQSGILCYALEYPRNGKRYEMRFDYLDAANAAFDAKLAELISANE